MSDVVSNVGSADTSVTLAKMMGSGIIPKVYLTFVSSFHSLILVLALIEFYRNIF